MEGIGWCVGEFSIFFIMSDVETRMKVLEDVPLLDNTPHIEGPTLAFSIESEPDWGYRDADAFNTRWNTETKFLSEMVR